jgi:virginiamycin A acetyltransferase
MQCKACKKIIRNILKPVFKMVAGIINFTRNSMEPEIDARVSIGHHTYGLTARNFLLFKKDDRVTIGKFCSFAYGVVFVASGEHNYSAVSNYPFYSKLLGAGDEKDTYSKGPINIGNDVWVGANATILSGVTVGDGAVIAAGSLVAKDVPSYSIVGGVPAKVIKYRFSQGVISKLLTIRWWDRPDNVLLNSIDDFYNLSVEEFIEKYAE